MEAFNVIIDNRCPYCTNPDPHGQEQCRQELIQALGICAPLAGFKEWEIEGWAEICK